MKMLGYTGEIERNFDVSPSGAPVGVLNFGSNRGWASLGGAEPIDRGANPSRCRRVKLHQGVDDASFAMMSFVPVFEPLRALNTSGCRSDPLTVHGRESGERSYL